MEIEMRGEAINTFTRSIGCFKNICKYVILRENFAEKSFEVYGISESKTSWLSFSFSTCFFKKFSRSLSEEDHFETSVSTKTLHKCLCMKTGNAAGNSSNAADSSTRVAGSVKKFCADKVIINSEKERDVFFIQFVFSEFNIIQTTTFYYNDDKISSPKNIIWKRRNFIKMKNASILCNALDKFTYHNYDILLLHDRTNHTIKLSSRNFGKSDHLPSSNFAKNSNIFTEIFFDDDLFDFLYFDQSLPEVCSIAFSLREIRSILNLSNYMNIPLIVTYRAAGLPLIVHIGKNIVEFISSKCDYFQPNRKITTNDSIEIDSWSACLWLSTTQMEGEETCDLTSEAEDDNFISSHDETEKSKNSNDFLCVEIGSDNCNSKRCLKSVNSHVDTKCGFSSNLSSNSPQRCQQNESHDDFDVNNSSNDNNSEEIADETQNENLKNNKLTAKESNKNALQNNESKIEEKDDDFIAKFQMKAYDFTDDENSQDAEENKESSVEESDWQTMECLW